MQVIDVYHCRRDGTLPPEIESGALNEGSRLVVVCWMSMNKDLGVVVVGHLSGVCFTSLERV